MESILTEAGLPINLALLLAPMMGSPVRARAQALRPFNQLSGFAVEFSDCVESIGMTLVPTNSVRAYVPGQFTLAGEGRPVTPLVVRTARCSIGTAGHRPTSGEIVQIGAVINSPDFTGDINNYTIWYYTSDLRLALRLLLAGLSAQYVPTIDYNYDTHDNSFHVQVPRPGTPSLTLSGTVSPSSQPAGSFVANWWQATRVGKLKMSTSVPITNIGGSDLTVSTNLDCPLGQFIGSSSTRFPIIQQFNTFAAARMQVAVAP